MDNFYANYPVEGGGSSGVTSLNGLTGALTLVAGSGISIVPSGSNITISATGGSGFATVALDNLVSTAINADLVPGIDNTILLGHSTLRFASGYIHRLKDSTDTEFLDTETRIVYDALDRVVARLDSRTLVSSLNVDVFDWQTTSVSPSAGQIIQATGVGARWDWVTPTVAPPAVRLLDSSSNTVSPSDSVLLCETTDSSAATIDLPAGTNGMHFSFSGVGAGAFSYTITAFGGDSIDPSAPVIVNSMAAINYIYLSSTSTWYAY